MDALRECETDQAVNESFAWLAKADGLLGQLPAWAIRPVVLAAAGLVREVTRRERLRAAAICRRCGAAVPAERIEDATDLYHGG